MEAGAAAHGDASDEQPAKRRPYRAHKLATSMAFVVVFFAAASFTAGAGDMVAKALDPARCAALQVTGEDDSVCAEALQEEAAPEAMPLPETAAAPEAAESAEPVEPPRGPAELVDDLAAGEAGADFESVPAEDASLASEPCAAVGRVRRGPRRKRSGVVRART